MRISGDPDPLYVAARRVLLDSLEAMEQHLRALVLVGTQAVYLQTGEADMAVSPYTTDGDLVIEPTRLGPEPLIEVSMEQAGFRLSEGSLGIWQINVDVEGIKRTGGSVSHPRVRGVKSEFLSPKRVLLSAVRRLCSCYHPLRKVIGCSVFAMCDNGINRRHER